MNDIRRRNAVVETDRQRPDGSYQSATKWQSIRPDQLDRKHVN